MMAGIQELKNLPNSSPHPSQIYEGQYLKGERIRIPKLNYDESFDIGILASNLAKKEFPNGSVVVDISLPNGHCIFRMVTNADSSLDDDDWIKRNRETAMRYRCSSFLMGLKFYERLGKYDRAEFSRDPKYYVAFNGGALPIFVGSCGIPAACLTVSGLSNCQNHWLAVESIKSYILEIEGSPTKNLADCAICLSKMQISAEGILKTNGINGSAKVLTECNHVFHKRCLENQTIYSSQPCPVCGWRVHEDTWKSSGAVDGYA